MDWFQSYILWWSECPCVPSWWHCLGRFRGRSLVGGSMLLSGGGGEEEGFVIKSFMPLPVCSLYSSRCECSASCFCCLQLCLLLAVLPPYSDRFLFLWSCKPKHNLLFSWMIIMSYASNRNVTNTFIYACACVHKYANRSGAGLQQPRSLSREEILIPQLNAIPAWYVAPWENIPGMKILA
jgi:hypothetical protein